MHVDRRARRRRATRRSPWPTPAEWVTQTASATQNPRQLAMLAHDREAVGGEREDAVEGLFDLRIVAGPEGVRWLAATPGAKSSSVNGSIDGIGSPAVSASEGRHVDRHRPVAVGADAEAVDVLAEVQVLVLVAQDRQAGLGSSVLRRRAAGTWPVRAYWWASGASGSVRPTCRRAAGPRTRRSTRRCRRRSTPSVGDRRR